MESLLWNAELIVCNKHAWVLMDVGNEEHWVKSCDYCDSAYAAVISVTESGEYFACETSTNLHEIINEFRQKAWTLNSLSGSGGKTEMLCPLRQASRLLD
jgi:hypothetical protein